MGYKKSLFWNIQKVSKKEGTNDLKKSFLDLDNIFQNSSGEKIKQVNIFLPVRDGLWCDAAISLSAIWWWFLIRYMNHSLRK